MAHMYEGAARWHEASRAVERFVILTRPMHGGIHFTSLQDAGDIRWKAGWHASARVAFDEMVREGSFREDLYYRISVIPIHVPPLRERRDDIPALWDHFLRLYASGAPVRSSPEDDARTPHPQTGEATVRPGLVHARVVRAPRTVRAS